jgi:NADH:ubiquinone oxidoreductase subunit C
MLNLSIFFPKYLSIAVKYSNFDSLVFGAQSVVSTDEEYVFICKILKNSSLFRFDYFVDGFALDFPFRENRFEVHYRLYSSFYSSQIHFIRSLTFNDGFVFSNSFVNFFAGANWFEREIWDIFGIFFFNHPDLRRILTDYGFDGFPLRKDFPISGYTQVRFDEISRKVVYEPVEFSQEFRIFDFVNPWI